MRYSEVQAASIRREIWAACVKVAATICGEPEEQAEDAKELYRLADDIYRRRYGDALPP